MSHIISQDCIGCGACMETCPVAAIIPPSRYFSDQYYIVEAVCIDCGACVDSCPVEAISPA